jgi:hypothetical protein
MKITVSKSIKTEIELPEFFKLAQCQWYYAIVDEKTMLHVKSSAWGYPLIEQVDVSLHSNVIAGNEIIEVTEQEFKDKFSDAYLRLSELNN